MVVVQILDSGETVARAQDLAIEPLSRNDHAHGYATQWHPRDFGVLVQLDQMIPVDHWNFAPAVYGARSTSEIKDIAGLTIAVADPEAVAERWANVTGAVVGDDRRSVDLGATLRFVEATDEFGVRQVDLLAADRARAGERFVFASMDFHLV
jgi:hypothetical protein